MAERQPRGGQARRGGRVLPSDPAKAHAQALHAKGMPYQLAMSVAQGSLTLNDALERMAHKEQADKLVVQHDLDRALAMQVVLGQLKLDDVLYRRRYEEHRKEYMDHTVLAPGPTLVLGVHGQRQVEGVVQSVDRYDVVLQAGEKTEAVHKLQIKYAYQKDVWKVLKKAASKDKVLSAAPLAPVERPQDRYGCSDKRLFRYVSNGREVVAVTLEGDAFRGKITWFSKFEFGLALKGGGEVVVFRHALHQLGDA